MYHFWRQNPLFRPALFLLSGILLTELNIHYYVWIAWLVFLNLISILGFRHGSWKRINFLIPSIYIAFGALLHVHQRAIEPPILTHENFAIELVSEPKIKDERTIIEAEVHFYDSLNTPILQDRLKTQVIFKNDASAQYLLPGDQLLLHGKLRSINASPNPSSFDYPSFMRRKGIYTQVWIDSGSWTKLAEHKTIKRFAVKSRNSILHTIDIHISTLESRAILKALLTGYTQELIPEIREVYAKSGTMHMLAVSGMHVGILLILLSQSLRWLRNTVLKNALLILSLWVFALFTGLSPSVMRAVSMCSLYLLAEALQREHRTWNALAFALIVLLVWDTQLLFNAGFQLSFLALSGILLVNTPRVPAKGWKQKARNWMKAYLQISLAAQLATAPIAIYYFQQFPLYFLLGNLLIVPLAAPLMYGGIFLLLANQISWLAKPLSWLLDHLLSLTHWLATQLSNLPNAAIPIESLAFSVVLLCYGLLLCFVLRVKLKRTRPILAGFLLSCLFVSWQGYDELTTKNQKGIIIYSSKSSTPMDYYHGNRVLLFEANNASIQESRNVFYRQRGIEQFDTAKQEPLNWGSSVLLDSARFLFYHSETPCSFPKSSLKTVLILEKDAFGSLPDLLDSLNFCNIVLARNLSWKSRKHWQKQADSLGLSLYDIRTEGAFEFEYGSTR